MTIIDSSYKDINTKRIEILINFILAEFKLSNKEISVSFVNDNEIQELNNQYRNINKPTDVLSFALMEGEDMCDDVMLGDIVISYDTAIRQACELNHPLYIEIDNLICHSMLHLLGYDHIDEEDKKIMFLKHKEILNKFYTEYNCEEYIEDNWLLD